MTSHSSECFWGNLSTTAYQHGPARARSPPRGIRSDSGGSSPCQQHKPAGQLRRIFRVQIDSAKVFFSSWVLAIYKIPGETHVAQNWRLQTALRRAPILSGSSQGNKADGAAPNSLSQHQNYSTFDHTQKWRELGWWCCVCWVSEQVFPLAAPCVFGKLQEEPQSVWRGSSMQKAIPQ